MRRCACLIPVHFNRRNGRQVVLTCGDNSQALAPIGISTDRLLPPWSSLTVGRTNPNRVSLRALETWQLPRVSTA